MHNMFQQYKPQNAHNLTKPWNSEQQTTDKQQKTHWIKL